MGASIVFLGTGGTIAGRASDPGDNVGYTAGQIGVASLLEAIPQLQGALHGHACVSEQVAQVDSKDVGFALWQHLTERVLAHLKDEAVRAIVIAHGTDTMEETAFFLSCVLPRALLACKNVVLTGAMRPASALLADGPQNLLDAVAVALSPERVGVVVVCAGKVHSAVDVRKSHTYALDAFDSGDAGPLAYVEEGRLRVTRALPEDAPISIPLQWPRASAEWPWVELVYSGAGASGDGVRALLAYGLQVGRPLQGLVVIATGNGSIHADVVNALLEAQVQGVKVVRATRCTRGVIVMGSVSQAEFDHYPGLSGPKSRIALMLELMAKK